LHRDRFNPLAVAEQKFIPFVIDRVRACIAGREKERSQGKIPKGKAAHG